MSLLQTLRKDMITATKAGDKDVINILKMVLATIKNIQIDQSEELTDENVEKILRKETKKIEDSIAQYTQMERDDLVKNEKKDLDILQKYLPELMSEEKVREVVSAKIKELGATDMREMGKIMGSVMQELQGSADGNVVKKIVQEILSNG
ncbi:GatB/YqeY domain-containing protein [bacterium]|nr:GatB/YqeY domain-containing protein [bacterium]